MNTSNNSVGAALAALAANTSAALSHAPANVPNVNDRTGTVRKLTEAEKKDRDSEARYARQLIETYGHFEKLPDDRKQGLVEISIACVEEAERRGEFRAQFQLGIAHLFPTARSLDDWACYKHAARFVRYTFGDHAYKIFREEIRALCEFHGVAMPTAGTGSGNGTKGLTPHKFAQGMTSTIEALIDKATKAKSMKDKLDAKTMREVAELVMLARTVMQHVNKAVNE